MSLFNLVGYKEKLPGVIKIRSKNNPNFAHFSMEEAVVRRSLAATVSQINQNMRDKQVKGILNFCPFVNHDGNTIYI